MNFKLLCVFAALAVVAYAFPQDYKPYPTESALVGEHQELARFRRSPKDDDKKKEEPEFRFKARVEDSKQDGRSLYGETQWRAYESDNHRHKVDTYANGYYREGGDKYKYQPNNQRDSNYKYGATYEYTCC